MQDALKKLAKLVIACVVVFALHFLLYLIKYLCILCCCIDCDENMLIHDFIISYIIACFIHNLFLVFS